MTYAAKSLVELLRQPQWVCDRLNGHTFGIVILLLCLYSPFASAVNPPVPKTLFGGSAPIAVPDAFATTEGVALVVNAPGLISNDIDPEGDAFILTNATSPSNGTLTSLVTNGAFSYTPNPGFVGTDQFTYRIREVDTDQYSEYVTVTIVVQPNPNRSPIAVDDHYVTTEGVPLVVDAPGLLENDYDPDGEALLLQSAGGLANGTFTVLVTNGRFTYVPDPGFVGTEEFTYTMRDEAGNNAMGTAIIEVLPNPNRPPVAANDHYLTTEGVPLAVDAPGLLGNDYDPDGEALLLQSAGGLANGIFTVLVTNGRFTYVPNPGFVGTEEFTYTMRDESGNQATGTATIEVVAAGGTNPVAVTDAYITTEGAALVVDAPGLLENDYDPDGEALLLQSAGGLTNGTFTVLVTNGRFTYVADPGFVGTEEFTYTMRDESGNQATGTATIEVLPNPNRPPVAVNDHYLTPEGVPLVVDPPGLLGNDFDPDGEALLLQSAGGLANGVFTVLVTNGRFTYVPNPGFVGTEEFTYTIRDEAGNNAMGSASILVAPNPNRAPIPIPDYYITPAETPLVIEAPGLIFNDFDPDGDAIILNNASSPANGSLTTLVTNGSFTYVPDPGFTGTDEFSYQIRDSKGELSEPGIVTIFVFTPNEPPIANAGNDLTVIAGNEAVLDGTGSSDPDGDEITFDWMFGAPGPGDPIPAGSMAMLSDEHTATPSFVPDIPGTYSVQLIVNDGTIDSDPDYVLVTALSIPEALDLLAADIIAYGNGGLLNFGQTNALTRKITQAKNLYASGKITEVLEVLYGLRQQVSEFKTDGVLSESEADVLLTQIDDIISALGGSPIPPMSTRIGDSEINAPDIPLDYALERIYPNPVQTTARIDFSVPEASNVRIALYDLQGREVLLIQEGFVEAGNHGQTIQTQRLNSGVYMVYMKAGTDFSETRRILIE